MKSILSASVCAAVLALTVPAMAATGDAKPMHHKMHKMGKHVMGPHTKMKKAGDPSTDELNEKSLTAAKGGTASTGSEPAAAPAAAPATDTAPAVPSSSGTTGTAAPMNAPAGH